MLNTLSGKPVSKISLGGAAIGSCDEKVFFGKTVSKKDAVDTILFALDKGINLIDTSPFYGNSEAKIGEAVLEYGNRETFMISTKAGTHPTLKGYSAENILRSVENSLKMLRTSYLDVVHIHDPGIDDFDKIMEEGGGIETLTELRYLGVIRNIGLGVRNHNLHQKFIASGFANVILPYLDYNLISQSASQLLNDAKNKKIDVMLGSPLCMGLLSGKNPNELNISHFDVKKEVPFEIANEMYAFCHHHQLNLQALNLKFILSNPAVSTVVLGPSSKEELVENIQSLNENIPEEIYRDFMNHFNLAVATL